MGRNAERQAQKRRRSLASFRRILWLPAAILDKEEMRLFFAQQRFNWLVREVKRRLYRRPQGTIDAMRGNDRERQRQRIEDRIIAAIDNPRPSDHVQDPQSDWPPTTMGMSHSQIPPRPTPTLDTRRPRHHGRVRSTLTM